MREILFRGKRVDNGGWVEGYYAVKGKDTDLEKHFIVTSTFDSNTNAYPFYFTDNWVEPETICQYTGLTDKNGRKIFEGDIVKINNDVKEAFEISDGAVVYRGGSFIVGGGNGTLNSLFAITDINYVLRGEVIGNIFDNPELIGDQP